MTFSINPICLYPGKSRAQAFQSLKAAGYDTFELWSLAGCDLDALKADMEAYGMRLTVACPRFFTLNDPNKRQEYLDSLEEALGWVQKLGGRGLITQVGMDTGAPREKQHESIVEGLMRCAPLLEAAGLTLLVEPLNTVKDHKGYYLTSSQEGFDIIRQVGSLRVRLLYDVYHQVHMGEDPLAMIAPNLELIAHFHVAGHPDRDEKLWGAYDYRPLFTYLNKVHCPAPIGVELFPSSEEKARALLMELKEFA